MYANGQNVYAIIPVHGRDDVIATVPKLLSWYRDLHAVVVDNGNVSNVAVKLASLSGERVEVLRLDENRGGSGGYIAGMRQALERQDCEFVWLLDDDAEPNGESLTGLMATYRELVESGEAVASVGSTIVSKSNSDTIVECGAMYLNSHGRVEISRVLNGEMLSKHANETIQVEYCAGCSCLIHRSALEKVGLWEDVFIHYDDVEWGLRAEHKFGLKNFATTRSTVKHPDRSSSDAWIQYYDMYNKLWLDRMYAPKAYDKERFIARMYELFSRICFLNHGKYYAYRLIMSDFRVGKRRLRADVESLFKSHGIRGELHLLSLPHWLVGIRKKIFH